MSAYDFEDAIYKAWQTSEDLDVFFHYYGNCEQEMTEDDVLNTLLGLKKMHDMRMEQLFDLFKKQFELDEYCTDPKKLAMREKILGDLIKPKKKGKK